MTFIDKIDRTFEKIFIPILIIAAAYAFALGGTEKNTKKVLKVEQQAPNR